MMIVPFSGGEIYSFLVIVALLVIFPGPNTVLVMQSVSGSGRRAGFFNVLGIVTAVYFNALLSGAGLSLIIMQSAQIYNLLKMLGAGYIIYLGAVSLIDAYRLHRGSLRQDFALSEVAGECCASHKRSIVCYSQGLFIGVLNPHAALFFFAFFPQFIHQEGSIAVQTLILTLLYSLVSATWYGSLVFFLGKLRQLLTQKQTLKWLKATTGILLVGMGVKITMQR